MRKFCTFSGVLLVFAALTSSAETSTFPVKGMTCGACVKSIEAKVCALDFVDKSQCNVSIGKVVLTSKKGKTIDAKAVASAVEAAGSNFSLITTSEKK